MCRIFSEFSALTPIQYAERYRLFQCVEYIRKGNSLRDTAIQFGYTPEGLSNAMKNQLGLTFSDIKKENNKMSMKNGLRLGSSAKFIEQYKWEFDQLIFMDFWEALEEQKIINHVAGTCRERLIADGVILYLDYKRVLNILHRV